MKKFYLATFIFCLTLFSCSPHSPARITGLWKVRDPHSEKPRGLVFVYQYHGKYYGRMIATYDNQGHIKDSIIEKKEKAPGVVGTPPYCGMDFIYNLQLKKNTQDDNPVYLGKILDPQKGKVYTAEVWRKNNNLVVRGELFIFGKDILWPKASYKDLPKGVSENSLKKLTPTIPKAR